MLALLHCGVEFTEFSLPSLPGLSLDAFRCRNSFGQTSCIEVKVNRRKETRFDSQSVLTIRYKRYGEVVRNCAEGTAGRARRTVRCEASSCRSNIRGLNIRGRYQIRFAPSLMVGLGAVNRTLTVLLIMTLHRYAELGANCAVRCGLYHRQDHRQDDQSVERRKPNDGRKSPEEHLEDV